MLENNNISDNSKLIPPPAPAQQAAMSWGKPSNPQHQAPAPPPVWTRYIDSRLKQFCAR